MDMADAMKKAWSYRAPRSYLEMHRAHLFEGWDQSPPAIERWTKTGKPPRLLLTVFQMHTAETVVEGHAFVSEMLLPGLVPIGGDRSGDAWCFDTRRKIGGTTPIMHVPHDGGGGVYVAPSFAGFVYALLLENLQYLQLWQSTRDDLVAATLRNTETAAPWLLRRWREDVERVARSSTWPDFHGLSKHLRRDPAFARLPEGEQDVFRVE